MKMWKERPKEVAHLLNPAFCCIIMAATIEGYTSTKGKDVPFPLLFMVLPIVLHKNTRDALPPNTRTSMAAWIQENASARVLFYERLLSLKPFTRETVLFGMLYGWVVSREAGLIGATMSEANLNRAIRKLSDEARECVMRARFLGKWFAAAGTTSTVMALWGIRP